MRFAAAILQLCAAAWLIWLALTLAGCSFGIAKELNERNAAIQECILGGGHPHLGPNNSVICTR